MSDSAVGVDREPDEEEPTARLLRTAAPRPKVAADRAARVRRAVHLEWQAALRRRMRRRTAVTAAAAVTLAAAAVIIIAVSPKTARLNPAPGPVEPVAIVERLDGQARRSSSSDSGGKYVEVHRDDRLMPGESLETDASSRTALGFENGTSIRLDTGSTVRLLSAAVIELSAGALYVDTGGRSAKLEIRTRFGVARDVGTQFEVRLQSAAVRIRVRSGAVEVRQADRAASARAGTELMLGAGQMTSRSISVFGPEWEWSETMAPIFEIEGRPLNSFLTHLGQEHGWTVRYADPQLAEKATTIILHGSVDGLSTHDALEVTLAASGLAHRLHDGELIVYRERSSK